MSEAKNVLGEELEVCSIDPMTGFFRDGCCETGVQDTGTHVVCAQVTQGFLEFTKARGNDLSTPRANFPGLKPGDRWCLCVSRWKEALDAGVAPPIVLSATHEEALSVVSIEQLQQYALSEVR